MSATDELRRMLYERGVGYDVRDGKAIKNTYWEDADGRRWGYASDESGVFNDRQLFLIHGRMDFTPEQAIAATLGTEITGETSDGFHTMAELYHHRAVLFSVIVRDHRELAWKSMRHHDGTMYDGMFIVGIETPKGQATYHYDIDPYWDMFDCKELDQAPEWDGHSPADAIERIATLGTETCRLDGYTDAAFRVVQAPEDKDFIDYAEVCECSACGASVIVPHEYERITAGSDELWPKFNFCPNCGAKVVDAEVSE